MWLLEEKDLKFKEDHMTNQHTTKSYKEITTIYLVLCSTYGYLFVATVRAICKCNDLQLSFFLISHILVQCCTCEEKLCRPIKLIFYFP